MLKVVVHINILGLLFVLICFASCKADCSEQNHCIENNTEQNNILILLYPIATPENVRYSINVQDHFVRFVYHDSMPPDSIDVNLNESEYNSIVSCVIKKEYRNKNYGKLLMETVLSDLNSGYACCLTISKDGYKLANKYMKLKMKLNDEVSVFEKNK